MFIIVECLHEEEIRVKHTTNQAKATVPNHHFSSAFTHNRETTLPDMGLSLYPNLPDIDLNMQGLLNFLKSKEIYPYKATGPDCIPAKHLKEMAEEFSLSLALIFTISQRYHRIRRRP